MRAYEIQQKEIERQQAIIARYRMFNREKSIRAAESREKASTAWKAGKARG